MMQNIESIEKRLWASADNLRANSNYASNEYFMPVMGLIFLRHAYSRYLGVKDSIEASLPSRGGKIRPLTKEDFSRRSAIFLRPEAQFDYLVNLKDSEDRAQKIYEAMDSIEEDYEGLKGVLPKSEYKNIDNDILGQLLRTFNDPALNKATGDVFGRIYEYFLTEFADQKAHDGGEFFTPVSLVQMIVNVIEPTNGKILDPACGSGGMFVQSAHFIEHLNKRPNEQVTFYGMEKNPTTIRLAKMNLAVHGLEGNIQKAISYYEDPHEMLNKSAFVMANPPFNVDEVDEDKIKNDPRLPFGLPGVNKKKKVSNGNYLWISYFYSYLNDKGRAGFVMSSQASSAGRDEAKVRQKIVETGHVDVMIAIRSNFFYTRTVPCELWFFNKSKPKELKDKVLMLDARNIYRKVTRKIYDFSPEQMKNLTSTVWLYRGESERFIKLIEDHLENMMNEASSAESIVDNLMSRFGEALSDNSTDGLGKLLQTLKNDVEAYKGKISKSTQGWKTAKRDNGGLHNATQQFKELSESSRDLIKSVDHLFKMIEDKNRDNGDRASKRNLKEIDEVRRQAVEQLKTVRYFFRHATWLQERFPEAKLRDVEGLVKLVDIKEIKDNDWSLTPGRYVGVAPEEEDENFDFEEALKDIHLELAELNKEATDLASKIQKNFEELGI